MVEIIFSATARVFALLFVVEQFDKLLAEGAVLAILYAFTHADSSHDRDVEELIIRNFIQFFLIAFLHGRINNLIEYRCHLAHIESIWQNQRHPEWLFHYLYGTLSSAFDLEVWVILRLFTSNSRRPIALLTARIATPGCSVITSRLMAFESFVEIAFAILVVFMSFNNEALFDAVRPANPLDVDVAKSFDLVRSAIR